MAIPSEIIEAVRERTSLVDVISESVKLRPAGKNHLGLCPFHREKTPSFNVREDEGTYHCFGCGKHGSVFDFVMETRGLSFPEAVSFLANRIGIKIPESGSWKRSDADTKVRERQKLLRAITAVSSSIFSDALWRSDRGAAARQYLTKRGVSEEMCRKFMLGYAPAGWDFIVEAARQRLEQHPSALLSPSLEIEGRLEELLLDAGLVRLKREDQAANDKNKRRVYDTFRDRLIFTISRSDGAPVAFGGRDMTGADKVPKYINSPETPIYLKRKTLYGLSQALPAIRRERHVYLVEGYFDVISMFHRGFENTVASCGTAIASDHVAILKRFVDRATIIFDGDSAGRKAAASCVDLFINSGIDVSVVMLEEGEDPDSICRALDHTALQTHFAERERKLSEVFIAFQFEKLGADRESASAVVRGKVGESFATLASRVTNSVEREALIRSGAERIGISFAALEELVGAKASGKPGPKYDAAPYSEQSAEPNWSSYEEAPLPEPPEWVQEANEQFTQESAPRESTSQGRKVTEQTPWWRDLLVVGLAKPQLADRLLKLLSSSDISVPTNVLELLRVLSETELSEESSWEELEGLLVSREFDAKQYKVHVARARYVGGVQVERLLESVASDSARSGLKDDLLRLRDEEAQASDEDMLQRLVQEKLDRKRAISMMGRQTGGKK